MLINRLCLFALVYLRNEQLNKSRDVKKANRNKLENENCRKQILRKLNKSKETKGGKEKLTRKQRKQQIKKYDKNKERNMWKNRNILLKKAMKTKRN